MAAGGRLLKGEKTGSFSALGIRLDLDLLGAHVGMKNAASDRLNWRKTNISDDFPSGG